MMNTRTAAATAAATRARSLAALERRLRDAATLLHLNGWRVVAPDGVAEPDSDQWVPGDRVR